MASTLYSTISFNNVADGGQATLAHGLNVNSTATLPDLLVMPTGFSYVTATTTTVTVQNDSGALASGVVLAHIIYSAERSFPAAAANLTTKPYVITPGGGGGGGGGGTQYVFVFRPGGTAGGNVYTDFDTLYAALTAVEGEKLIQFDDSLGAIVLAPASAYDLSGCRLEGFGGVAIMSIDDDVLIGNGGSMRDLQVAFVGDATVEGVMRLDNTTWSGGPGSGPGGSVEASGASIFLLDNSQILNPNGFTPWVNTTTAPASFYGGDGGTLQRQAVATTNGYNLYFLSPTAALCAAQGGSGDPPVNATARGLSFSYLCDGTEGSDFTVTFPFGIQLQIQAPEADYTVTATMREFTNLLIIACGPSRSSFDFQVQTSAPVAAGDVIDFQAMISTGTDDTSFV